jgi:hypothetical protein
MKTLYHIKRPVYKVENFRKQLKTDNCSWQSVLFLDSSWSTEEDNTKDSHKHVSGQVPAVDVTKVTVR